MPMLSFNVSTLAFPLTSCSAISANCLSSSSSFGLRVVAGGAVVVVGAAEVVAGNSTLQMKLYSLTHDESAMAASLLPSE